MSTLQIRKSTYAFTPELLSQFSIKSIQEGQLRWNNDDVTNTDDPTSTNSSLSHSHNGAQPELPNLVENAFLCSACRVGFDEAEEFRLHSHTKWHVTNVKNVASGRVIISEEEFDQSNQDKESDDIVNDDQTVETISESSGDESSGSDDQNEDSNIEIQKHASMSSTKIIFSTESQQIHVWKVLLESLPSYEPFHARARHYLTCFRRLNEIKNVAILLAMGGRFAGGIWKENTCTVHRAFQRYTVRKKQGGSQSTQDESGRWAKSVGASIRRKESKRFREEVQKTISEWQPQLDSCRRIFIFAPSHNASIFTEVNILKRGDPRIASIPLTVRRPTFIEAERIWRALTTIEFTDHSISEQEITELLDKSSMFSQNQESTEDHQKSSKKEKEKDSTQSNDLVLEAIALDDLSTLTNLYASNYERPIPHGGKKELTPALFYTCIQKSIHFEILSFLCSVEDINEPAIDKRASDAIVCWGALHAACAIANVPLITFLLEHDADPSVKDSRGRKPYSCIASGDAGKNARMCMRIYAGKNPDQWDWADAGVQIYDAAEEEKKQAIQKEKAKAKKKAQRERQKEREKAEKELAAQAQIEAERKAKEKEESAKKRADEAKRNAETNAAVRSREQTLSFMSDREKRALAAERRIAATQGKSTPCAMCDKPITRLPFSRLQYQYCTLECMHAHRLLLDQRLRS